MYEPIVARERFTSDVGEGFELCLSLHGGLERSCERPCHAYIDILATYCLVRLLMVWSW